MTDHNHEQPKMEEVQADVVSQSPMPAKRSHAGQQQQRGIHPDAIKAHMEQARAQDLCL